MPRLCLVRSPEARNACSRSVLYRDDNGSHQARVKYNLKSSVGDSKLINFVFGSPWHYSEIAGERVKTSACSANLVTNALLCYNDKALATGSEFGLTKEGYEY